MDHKSIGWLWNFRICYDLGMSCDILISII